MVETSKKFNQKSNPSVNSSCSTRPPRFSHPQKSPTQPTKLSNLFSTFHRIIVPMSMARVPTKMCIWNSFLRNNNTFIAISRYSSGWKFQEAFKEEKLRVSIITPGENLRAKEDDHLIFFLWVVQKEDWTHTWARLECCIVQVLEGKYWKPNYAKIIHVAHELYQRPLQIDEKGPTSLCTPDTSSNQPHQNSPIKTTCTHNGSQNVTKKKHTYLCNRQLRK